MQDYRNYIHLCFTGEKVEETVEEKIKRIANHYGLEHQICKAKEELQELYTALLDYKEDDSKENLKAIITEIADVEIMTSQLKYLLNTNDKVEKEKLFKIKRQLRRMEDE